jgi:hypothetical protein
VQRYDIGRNATVGAGQTAERYAYRMRAAFKSKMPPGACTATGISAHLTTDDGQADRRLRDSETKLD